jgi:hypothetical protein
MRSFVPFSLLLVVLVAWMQPTWAQFTGLSAELDTMLWATESPDDPLADLAYYGVYDVYANFTDSSDVLSAVYSDFGALGTPPMGIDAPCGCHNPAETSITVDASNAPAFYEAFPAWTYDSFWTIGMETTEDDGQLPSSVNLPPATELCAGLGIDNGSLYITGSTNNWPANAVAGDDLKVLIARVTTCSDFSIQACIQVFVGGSQDSVQQACPEEPLLVLHQGCTEPNACNYNPSATTDDGTCVFDDGIYGCDGECITDTDGDGICDQNELGGCTDAGACNFDASATDDDGTCEYETCAGCANGNACNFDPEATIEDGSCFFPGDPCDDAIALTEGDVIQADCECLGYSCYDPDACNYSEEGISDESLCSYITLYDITGNAEPFSQNIQDYTYTNTAGSSYDWIATGGDIVGGQGDNVVSVVWNVEGSGQICVLETNADGCSGEEVCFDVNITLTSVDELLEGTLDVFPVPAVNDLQVVWTGPTVDNAFVVLRDATGRNVLNAQVTQRDVLDVSALSSGTYMLEFTIPQRGSIQRRVVIR